MMKRYFFLLFIMGMITTGFGNDVCARSKKIKAIKVLYYKNIYGNLHQKSNQYSETLTTISCGHPVKVYVKTKEDIENDWYKVKVGFYSGYIQKKYLTRKKPKCFQNKYPRFFDHFEMEITDLYYFARLYDMYVQGKSKVR